MTLYANYTFYSTNYLGDMSEENFNKYITSATIEVRNATFGRDITGYEEEVYMATCAVVDILYKIKQLEDSKSQLSSSDSSNRSVTSKKVGDLQINYEASISLTDLETEISNQKAKIKSEIEKYLIFTGLLYRGI